MLSAQDYANRVSAIIGPMAKGEAMSQQWRWSTAAEAKLSKAKITQMQKELRLVKKDIALTKKAINAAYTTERTKVGKGFGAGFAAGLLGKKAVGRANAAVRDNVRRNQLKAIAPYDDVSRVIDSILVQLDQLKLQLDSWIAANSATH
ncbi:MAG: hypothetical protein FJZ89_01635 [Chloroflexi bacterium]|nr:hypothetical protein [Chloroflexota bacterium]